MSTFTEQTKSFGKKTEDFKVAQKELKKQRKLLQKEAGTLAKEIAEAFLREEPSIKVFTVCGYTPSFNDGDPCTHSSDLYLNCLEESGTKFSYDEPEELFEVFGKEALVREEKYDSYYFKDDPEYGSEEYKRIDKKSTLLFEILDAYLEDRYDTNYALNCWLDKEGNFNWEEEEYYCGY